MRLPRSRPAPKPAGPPPRQSFRDNMTPAPAPAPRRRVDARALALRFLTTASGLVVGAALYSSPVLYVRHVVVRGTGSLLPAERAVTAQVVQMRPRSNLLRMSPARVEAAVRRLPWIASARVRRRLPDTVEIAVFPRRPAAAITTPAGAFELDAKGIAIRPSASPTGIPLIAASRPIAAHPGLAVADPSAQAAVAIALWGAERARGRVAKIEVDQAADLCLNTDDDVVVRLGQPDGLTDKLAVLARIYAREPGISARVREINLTCPRTPACTLRDSRAGPVASPAAEAAAAHGGEGPRGQEAGGTPSVTTQTAP